MLEGILPQINTPVILLGVMLVLFLLYFIFSTSRHRREPPGPRPLPLLGNLLSLDRKLPQVSFCELSKKYGSVFTVHLGPKKVVVLAGYKTVKQALVTHAEEFGERDVAPLFGEIMQGHGLFFTNGPCWKEMRCFAQTNLGQIGKGKIRSEESIIKESGYLIQVLENFKGEPFDTTQPVNYSTSNIIFAVVYGARFDYADPTFKKIVDKANAILHMSGSLELKLYNTFPWLRWCCGWLLVNRAQILKDFAEYHEELTRLGQKRRDTLNPQDLRGYVDCFLLRQQQESNNLSSHFHTDNLYYTIGNLLAAGFGATGTALRWGLLLMAKYPHIQDQVQEELSRVLGDRGPTLEDRRNLPYTDAVIHEIQRVANIAPMSIPHKTSCDITFQGYFIKKGTTVIPLLTSVLQDEEEWETPHSFNPGHFLDEKGCFIKRDAFLPFSAGLRDCPGDCLSMMELFLFFIFLLQRFRFTPPPGVSEDDLDLTPDLVFTLNPSPHRLCAVIRA